MNNKGFTLIEVLSIIILLSLLALLVVPNVLEQKDAVNTLPAFLINFFKRIWLNQKVIRIRLGWSGALGLDPQNR